MNYTCPVCGFNKLEDPPVNNEICPSCGTQFGYHDFTRSHAVLRARWLSNGAHWHSKVDPIPYKWNAYEQLRRAGFLDYRQVPAAQVAETTFVDLGSRTTVVDIPVGAVTIKGHLYAIGRSVDDIVRGVRFIHA